MNDTRLLCCELSGLPTWAIRGKRTLARQGYTLWVGMCRNTVSRSPWTDLGTLSDDEITAILGAKFPHHKAEEIAIQNGWLEEYFDASGTPQTRVPK